jgi:hypothetical protein
VSGLDRWLDEEPDEDAVGEQEQAFVDRLANDPFAFIDEIAAERRGVTAEEIRRGYWRGRGQGTS